MYTQCPECSSVFEISPEHLGAASGMVQCGVCNTTFNALRRLTEQPPETADTPLTTKGDTSAEVESESQAQGGLFDDEPPSDDHPADPNEAPESHTIDDEATIAPDEFSHSNETPDAEDATASKLAEMDQNATDLQQADEGQTNNSDEDIGEAELDVSTEEVEATEEASADVGNTDHSDINENLVEAGPDDSVTGEDDEPTNSASPRDSDPERSDYSDKEDSVEAEPDDLIAGEDHEVTDATSISDIEQSKLNDNEDLSEAELDDSIAGEDDTSEIDESEVDAAEEELNELLEDLDEDDEIIIVNPDDLFSTSQVLDEWDIEEGEHDLEAILADETLHDENESVEALEARENAGDNHETDSDDETWEEQQDNDESDSSEPEDLEDSDQLEDLQDLDELGEFDEEDINDEDLIDVDQDDDDNKADDSDDKDSDVNDDDVDGVRNDDEELIDENQDAEAQDIDEHEFPDEAQDTEVEESDDKMQEAESDEADTSSDSDEDIDAVASDDDTAAEVEEPGETEPDSSAVLTEGVNGQFDEDGYDDAEDLKDLGHYLSPKKSLTRRLVEGLIAVVLAGLLLGQYVHHNRTELATHPKFGAHVRNAYSALGKDLRANWKVSDYRVARHTIVPNDDNADILMARATVVNNSGFERPLPLVRLQLKNRWGDPIFGRVFTPDEYLQGTAPDTLAGNGKLEVSLDLVHPAPNEEIGYSFDICLDTPAGPDCGTPEVFTK